MVRVSAAGKDVCLLEIQAGINPHNVISAM